MTPKQRTKTTDAIRNNLKGVDQIRAKTIHLINQIYPAGSRVAVRLKSGQVNLTPATVIGALLLGDYGPYTQPYVRVEIDTAKPNSRLAVRSVHLTAVVPLES